MTPPRLTHAPATPPSFTPSRGLPPGLVWAAWTIPALLSTFETVMFMRAGSRPIELWRAFASEAPGWYTWALLTPVIALLAARFPLMRPIQPRAVLAHMGGWLIVASAAASVWAAASIWLRGARGTFVETARVWFLSGLPFTVLGYSAVVGICYMIANREIAREREAHAANLARQLTEAQLATLRAQLQPHFLFNSLNAIMALVRDTDSARAIGALTTLSAILRASLKLGSASEIALSQEVAFTRDYLDLERLRFPDRLQVAFEIPPALLDARVPTFMLQPFVENSIKHGLMDSREGILINIAARSDGDTLVITITDDGVGGSESPAIAQSAPPVAGGVGIANAKLRLSSMYGVNGTLAAEPLDAKRGFVVQMRIPLARGT